MRAPSTGGTKKLARIPKRLKESARNLRKNETRAEEVLWEALRDRRFAGVKFRRQRPVGKYIVDFYCHSAKLVIELDGAVHDLPGQKERDLLRQAEIEAMGYRVIRFSNQRIFRDLDRVLNEIHSLINNGE